MRALSVVQWLGRRVWVSDMEKPSRVVRVRAWEANRRGSALHAFMRTAAVHIGTMDRRRHCDPNPEVRALHRVQEALERLRTATGGVDTVEIAQSLQGVILASEMLCAAIEADNLRFGLQAV